MPRVKQTDTNPAENYNRPFAKRLRILLEENNISQTQLANELGITRQAVNSYMLGNSLPDIEKFQKMASFFNVSYEYLLGETESKRRENINVYEKMGLSDSAIQQLENIQFIATSEDKDSVNWKQISIAQKEQDAINLLLSSSLLPRLLDSVSEYIDTIKEQRIYDNMSENEKRAREIEGTLKTNDSIEALVKNIEHQIKYATSAQRVIKGPDLIEFFRQQAQKNLSDILEEGGKDGEH